MLSRTFGFSGHVVLTLLTTLMLAGQSSPDRYRALKELLGLGDAEPVVAALTESQRGKLKEVADVLNRAWVYQAVTLGLISQEQWRGWTLCYDEGSSQSLDLTSAQIGELARLRGQSGAARVAVLTDLQRERLASYEAQLRLVNQALELGLVKRPGERLCH